MMLVALSLLEIFPGDALLYGFFLEVFHGIEFHFLAHLIELLDQFGVASDAEIFALVEKELLVDEIAENVFFAVGIGFIGICGILRLTSSRS